MDNRKFLRIGKSVVHGRTGPLRGDLGNAAEEQERGKGAPKGGSSGNGGSSSTANSTANNATNNAANRGKPAGEAAQDEGALNSHFNAEESENNSGDIFEQLLQRELAKGALGGGVVGKNASKVKGGVGEECEKGRGSVNGAYDKRENASHSAGGGKRGGGKAETEDPTENPAENRTEDPAEDPTEDLSQIDLTVRVNSSQVKFRMHGYNQVIKCFSGEGNTKEKMEVANLLFKEEDSVLKYLGDNNLICQIKAAEMTAEYIRVLKEIHFYSFKEVYPNEEELTNSFVNDVKNKLFAIFTKIERVLIEKILTNAKSFDSGYSIVSKIIEFCSSDKVTVNVLTVLCEHMHGIYLKANKSVSNIKGVKIKVISSVLQLLHKLLSSFGASVICVKTLNKFCLKFNEMVDKSVKSNFYLLYIEMLSQIKNAEFHNCILNELNSQQKNYITKELQKEEYQRGAGAKPWVSTYLLNQGSSGQGKIGADGDDHPNDSSFSNNLSNLIEEADVFKEICTKQWEKRVLEGCIDKNVSSGNNNNSGSNSLSNENLLPWKIKVEAINLLCDKMKAKCAIKKTPYISTLLSMINKLLKNESALPVVVSTLKLLHVFIEKFEKEIYATVKSFSFILCAKLKDSNKQVSNACMECLTKAICVYNMEIFIDDLSKNLKDKNNNTRMVTLEFLLKVFEHVDRKNVVSIIEVTKHLLNDTVANIKNTACKMYALIVTNFGEEVHPAFFAALPANKKKSILALCVGGGVASGGGSAVGNSGIGSGVGGGVANSAGGGAGRPPHGEDPPGGRSTGGAATQGDNVEQVLPRNITNNMKSNSYTAKIEAINELTKWIGSEMNMANVHLENLLSFIKKNCYDFKGKYIQLNNAVYDFFNQLVDHLYHFNIHQGNNPHFVKVMSVLIPLYMEKTKDKRDSVLCNNFLQKCFQYFDNNVVMDIVIRSSDAKNAKKCEECIKMLQRLFLLKAANVGANTGPNTGAASSGNGSPPSVNVKSLIFFLKKFVDSKNTNLKNSSILLLQLLSRNYGDKYVLSHLEGISESVRQSVKSKEDVERFVQRQGLQSSLQSSASLVRAADANKCSGSSVSAGEMGKKQVGGQASGQATAQHSNRHAKWGEANQEEPLAGAQSNTVEIDYSNTYLNYKSTKIVAKKEDGGEQFPARTKESEAQEQWKGANRNDQEDYDEGEDDPEDEQGEDEEEEEEEEKMVNISDLVRQHVSHIMSDGNERSNHISKIINVIEKVGKYYINPERLEVLINKHTMHKILSISKSKCAELLYVLMFSLRDNVHLFVDTLLDCIVKMIDDADVGLEQIDKLLSCLCKNVGISKYIGYINGFIMSEKLSNMREEGGAAPMYASGQSSGRLDNQGRRSPKRNKIHVLISNINTNHILLLNEKVIKKKVLGFYLDLFFDDCEEVRQKSSQVLDHIYAKYKGAIFLEIYEKLSLHKKECLQDIINQMKASKEDFSFYAILMSNHSQLKRLSNNESNLSGPTPTLSKSRSIKRLSSISKNKILKIEFPPHHKIKADGLKWEKHFDQAHANYLTREFKPFSSPELIVHMFSDNANVVNRSILFFKDYLSNSSNQSTLFSKSGFLGLLLKWIFYTLNGHQSSHELLCACVNLLRIILKTIEDNYVYLNEQELVMVVNFIWDRMNAAATSSEMRKKLKEILLCLCYISDHKLYFSLLLKNLSSCNQKRICDSLDLILKLLILYKEKCLHVEKDVMKILQVFTVHSKNKGVTMCCLKIFANIQSFCPGFYKCIDNDDISTYLKRKVDEFVENWPDYKICPKDTEDEENNSSYQSDDSEGIPKEEGNRELAAYLKNNTSQRNSIRKEVEGHVSEFRRNVEEVLEVKKKIEEIEMDRTNESYMNDQISYVSISNSLKFAMEGNSYSRNKEIFHILESKNSEKVEGSNSYENSLIYFRFVYLASFLYSNDVETISRVCRLIVENIVQVGKKSKNGNFILKESGNYIFKNFGLFITLIKGANYSLRFLFKKSFAKDINQSFVHFNAILSNVLLVDILMKKKSCIARLSFNHFSFFFINTIVCLSIYTKVIHTNKSIYFFKNGSTARSLVTSILNNLLGREFLTSHSKLLEYVCNVSLNLGFDIMKNKKILLDDLTDTSEFYIYTNTYIKILNKIYKKIMNKICEEDRKDNPFVYRILHLLFLNLHRYDIYLGRMQGDRGRKRKMEGEQNEASFGGSHNSGSFYGKKVCNGERLSGDAAIGGGAVFPGENSDHSVFDCRAVYYENLGGAPPGDAIPTGGGGGAVTAGSGAVIPGSGAVIPGSGGLGAGRASNAGRGGLPPRASNGQPRPSNGQPRPSNTQPRPSNTLLRPSSAHLRPSNTQPRLSGTSRTASVTQEAEHEPSGEAAQRAGNNTDETTPHSREEANKVHASRMDFMTKYLFFIQLIFYGIKKNNPLILLAYVTHEIKKSYAMNLTYYYGKMEVLLNKDVRNCVPTINVNTSGEFYGLDFSFQKFLDEHEHLQRLEEPILSSYKEVFSQYATLDAESIYNSFDLSIDEVVNKKREFLESLKMMNVNEVAFNSSKYEHLKAAILEYINELQNTEVLDDLQSVDHASDYDFLCTMYRIPKEVERQPPGGGSGVKEGGEKGDHSKGDGVKGEGVKGEGEGDPRADKPSDADVAQRDDQKGPTLGNGARDVQERKDEDTPGKPNQRGEEEEDNPGEPHQRGEDTPPHGNITQLSFPEKKEVTFISRSIYLRNDTVENIDLHELKLKCDSTLREAHGGLAGEKADPPFGVKDSRESGSHQSGANPGVVPKEGMEIHSGGEKHHPSAAYDKKDPLNIFNNSKFETCGRRGGGHNEDPLQTERQIRGSQAEQSHFHSDPSKYQVEQKHSSNNPHSAYKHAHAEEDSQGNKTDYHISVCAAEGESKGRQLDGQGSFSMERTSPHGGSIESAAGQGFPPVPPAQMTQQGRLRNSEEAVRKTQMGVGDFAKERPSADLRGSTLRSNTLRSNTPRALHADHTLAVEEKPQCVLKRGKSNDGKYKWSDYGGSTVMRGDRQNGSSSCAVAATGGDHGRPLTKSKTNVKYLIKKYESQRDIVGASHSVKSASISSRGKNAESLTTGSNGSSTFNGGATHHHRSRANRVDNPIGNSKVPSFQVDKKKKYLYERSMSSSSFDVKAKGGGDIQNTSNSVRQNAIIRRSDVGKNFSNTPFLQKGEKRSFPHASHSNSVSSRNEAAATATATATATAGANSKSHGAPPSHSAKRKNNIGISIPLKKSILRMLSVCSARGARDVCVRPHSCVFVNVFAQMGVFCVPFIYASCVCLFCMPILCASFICCFFSPSLQKT
ncbi:TOG domain-containing protein, putative [Plasmodium vivax]|nr:TOG domain-containing protein, putative [Plasmodium vivax]